MNEVEARKILGDAIQEDGTLRSSSHYMSWNPRYGDVTLDDSFSADELEAIAWWMRNKANGGKEEAV